jgi:hypothetical protein
MIRADKIGAIEHLVEASSRRGAGIKLICPVSKRIQELSEEYPNRLHLSEFSMEAVLALVYL